MLVFRGIEMVPPVDRYIEFCPDVPHTTMFIFVGHGLLAYFHGQKLTSSPACNTRENYFCRKRLKLNAHPIPYV